MYNNINILTKALDASWRRNEVITNNIANAETPNFKRSDVIFEDVLREHLNASKLKGTITNANHIPINGGHLKDIQPQIKTDHTYSARIDNNNVEIDVEMAERAKNEIMYNLLTTRIQSGFKKIKYVINEGK
ncbi:flagellar basal body rod protein FlgB [Alkaliphilus oremlandii]|uniref:Flagellar basal body rod protein FlgB n=1 Tax=Alkaliphilus oremlandii (strain OhILAs) TaxID=350688 RepID=A8MHD3_ALKOO|nr:flagellar basal body rod protein FlgB [Alkaliphilus oremlandii]ABW19020.1 flagellar basal-body rod protein FlgB [Alkaliphilus oremlandii OhILAs]